MQLRELARVAWIGLDPVARPLRHQPRRDHVAVDPARDEVPIQAKAGRARLVTTAHPRPAPHRTLDSLMLIGQRPFLEQLLRADHSPPATGRRAQRGYGSILSRPE